jgi:DNA-binding response OmpR family regulator
MAVVVVMDDDSAIAKMVGTIVESEGHEVLLASSVAVAWELLARKPELMVLDVDMPNETGIDLVVRMRGDPAYEQIPVIFVSAFSDRTRPLQATGRGAVAVVDKPFSVQELAALVRRVLSNTERVTA